MKEESMNRDLKDEALEWLKRDGVDISNIEFSNKVIETAEDYQKAYNEHKKGSISNDKFCMFLKGDHWSKGGIVYCFEEGASDEIVESWFES